MSKEYQAGDRSDLGDEPDFGDFVEEISEMDDYHAEHFLAYRCLVEESWRQASSIYEDLDSRIKSYRPKIGNSSIQRYLSRRGIDKDNFMDEIKEMDKFIDLARYGELRSEETCNKIDFDDFENFALQMDKRDVENSMDMERAFQEMRDEKEAELSVFDSREEAFVIGLLLKSSYDLED